MELRAGYKQSELGVIPQDWEVLPLGNFLLIRHGKSQKEIEDKNGEYPILASGGEIGRTNKPLYSKPSVLIGRKGTINSPQYLDTPFWSVDTLFFSEIFNNAYPKFIYYIFNRINWYLYNEASGVPSLNAKTIQKISRPFPPTLLEQRAIATALSDVDALLDSLEQLIAKKRDLKQAAMQQLLTGQQRLEGFSEPWENCLVQDVVAKYFCGLSPTCEERNVRNNFEWGVLKTTAATKDFGWNWKAHKTLPSFLWGRSDLEVVRGDVIVTKAGPRHRVGVAVWVDFVPPRIIVSGKMVGLRPKPEKIVPLMLSAAISSPDSQIYLDQRTTGMAESQVNFENEALLETPIRIPSLLEQQAIATILSDMDAEIAALETRRDKTKALKHGMMQELLTGKTRLV